MVIIPKIMAIAPLKRVPAPAIPASAKTATTIAPPKDATVKPKKTLIASQFGA